MFNGMNGLEILKIWPRFEDGEPVRIGDKFECWCGETHVVSSVTIREGRSVLNGSQPHAFVVSDGPFTAHGKCVKRPAPKVLDADGAEIRVGDRVWSTKLDEPHEWIVVDPHVDRDDSQTVLVSIGNGTGHARPGDLTHQRPDSWERLEADAVGGARGYCAERGLAVDGCAYGQAKAIDLVRRCRALAERERGE